MSGKNIAVFVSTFPSYSETFIVNQINCLIESGYNVEVFTEKIDSQVKHSKALLKHNILSNVKTYEAKLSIPEKKRKRILKAIGIFLKNKSIRLLIIKALKSNKEKKKLNLYNAFFIDYFKKYVDRYDIVHAHFGPNGNIVQAFQQLGLFNARKTVVTFHGYDVHNFDAEFYESLFKSDIEYTVNSSFTRRKLQKLGALNKTTIIPMGVDELFFNDFTRPGKKDFITILSVARLMPVKGLEYGIKTVKLLIEKGYALKYIIVGEGPERAGLEKLINGLDLSEQVILVGVKKQEETYEYYRNADIFLLPGITTSEGVQEAQGLVIQEAQAMKLPVVITDAGGMQDGMISGETGFVVPEKDPTALSDKITILIKNPSLRKRMGDRGREFVKEKFDNKKLTQKLLTEVYEAE